MRSRTVVDILRSCLGVLSIVAPIICLIDCTVLPVAAIVLPLCGFKQFGLNHSVVNLIVFILCFPVLLWGCLKHRNKNVCFLFIAAFAMLILSEVLENYLDKISHFVFACIVGFLLIRTNYLNRRLLACSCAHGHK